MNMKLLIEISDNEEVGQVVDHFDSHEVQNMYNDIVGGDNDDSVEAELGL